MRGRHWLSLPLAIPKLFLAIPKLRVNATLQTTSKPLLPMILVKPFFWPARSGESNWRSMQNFVRNLTNKFAHKGIIKNIVGDITEMNKTLPAYGPEIYTQKWNVKKKKEKKRKKEKRENKNRERTKRQREPSSWLSFLCMPDTPKLKRTQILK